jgi:hypothetical protein
MISSFLFRLKSKVYSHYAINRPKNQAKNAGIDPAILHRAEHISKIRNCLSVY